MEKEGSKQFDKAFVFDDLGLIYQKGTIVVNKAMIKAIEEGKFYLPSTLLFKEDQDVVEKD